LIAPAGVGARRSSPAGLRLIELARKLLADGMLDAVAIDDLVRQAGVSKRSFYNHFEDRDALVLHVSAAGCAALQARLTRAYAEVEEPAARCLHVVLACMDYCSADPFRDRLLARTVHMSKGRDVPCLRPLIEAFTAAVDRGALKPASVEAGTALLLGTCLMGSSHLQRLRGEPDRARALVQAMTGLLLHGLGVDGRRHATLLRQAIDLAWRTQDDEAG
jgi:AcrR family transcriptional regulator